MADLALSVTESLAELIESEAIYDICSKWGLRNELQELFHTICTIKNVLFHASLTELVENADLTNDQQDYIAKVKDAIYEADNFFNEVRTLSDLHLIKKSSNKGSTPTCFGMVRHFFCCEKLTFIVQAHRMFRRFMSIKGHLDTIANDYSKFGFSAMYVPSFMSRGYAFSHVVANNIIGRDKDKDSVIDLLLSPCGDDDDGFHFLSIVGVGGIGKTTLAQLVFNDERIQKEFSSSRFWVCVSDRDGEQFSVKTILSKILEAVTLTNNSCSTYSIQDQFRQEVGGKKYLLVLDDVWNEKRDNWLYLRTFLMMGARGSKILVTTRSQMMSRIISQHVYKLEGLSIEDSQHLFEMSAFKEGEKCPELAKIGENIVRNCCRIPHDIVVAGKLLFGQEISMWQAIERNGLVDVLKGNGDKFLPILELSYPNLAPSLKRCFSYCAIYSKDFRFYKEILISLWLAQGYVVPFNPGQSVENAAEEHFSILTQRGFFQDIEKDEYGNIKFVKIHRLMHDVAQEVGKDEICVVSCKESKLGENSHHINIICDGTVDISLCSGRIRSYICNGRKEHLLEKQMEDLIALRVLDLSYSHIESLPQTIDRLVLLKYLNLCSSYLKVLPDSIIKLHNLQTLILRDCRNLREVPKDFSKMINLRHLDIYGCDKLRGMPCGILKLTKLRVLPYFAASEDLSDEELKVLQQALNWVRGKICISNMRRGDPNSTKPLAKLMFNFGFKGEWLISEGVLEKLELHPYLSGLGFSNYNGKKLPWPTTFLLRDLLRIEIVICSNLEQIPTLSNLCTLKSLKLVCLDGVEYMENGISSSSNGTKAVAEFFPSLESLEIGNMENLKGWWKGDFTGMKLCFPHLSHLKISGCPNLESFASCLNPDYMPELHLPSLCTLQIISCPNLASNIVCPSALEKLVLKESNERLIGDFVKLRVMGIDKLNHMKLLPPTNFCLSSLLLTGEIHVECALERVQSCTFSLQNLSLIFCENLRKFPKLNHFIALDKLTLRGNFELGISEEDDEEPWRSLPMFLRELVLSLLPKMKCLPKGISRLSSLQSLKIWDCQGIKSLPGDIKDLTSLEKLSIRLCPHLKERCKEPDGEDFSKIQHITDREIF